MKLDGANSTDTMSTTSTTPSATARSNKRLSIHLPTNKNEVYDLFSLSKTNQIMQGHSPTTEEAPAPQTTKDNGKKKKGKKKKKTKPPSPGSRIVAVHHRILRKICNTH
jgi:hypothetical protein